VDLIALRNRLRLGEDSRTEFKRADDSALKSIEKALVAFANSGGGEVFVGVEDDGTPTGVGSTTDADRWMRQITQLCQTRIEPALSCRIDKAETDGHLLLIVEIPAWTPNRPYRSGHIYYVRSGAESREASRDELVRMLQSRAIHFDEEPVRGASATDLDEAAVDRFLAAHYPRFSPDRRASYLRALKCYDDADRPTVTGVLFFGCDPQRFFADSYITAIRFRGARVSDEIADRKTFSGGLLAQAESAAQFLDIHVPSPVAIEGFTRKEKGIPTSVLREALHNALAHRDYVVASQVRIFAFDDRVEITNPGALLNRMTLDSIRIGGISQRRNPAIAAILTRSGLVELAGNGVPQMIDAMEAAGLPEPEFAVEGGHFRVVLRVRPREGT
jgi:ATP-dependent DNA helicase RecG